MMRETSSLASDVWHLPSSSWRNYANTVARPALRRAHVVEEAWLHGACGDYAGARDRREHGDFQRGQRHAVASAAVSATRPVGAFLGQQAAHEHAAIAALAAQFQRRARAVPVVREPERLDHRLFKPDARQGA